jgi:uncharacterized protein YcnI
MLAALGFTAGLVLAAAGPAVAHVTTDPASAPQGGEITLGFRSPNEEANAEVTQLEVDFPTDTPLLGVDVEPVPGWTAKVSEASLNPPVQTVDGPVAQAVSQIVWTAGAGGGTPPGQFQQFDVLVQRLPTRTNQVVFKALQTYSDGTIARWIDPVTADHPDPDHPTPILTLTPPDAGAGAAVPSTTSTAPSPSSRAADASGLATTGSMSSARTIGIIGLAVGSVGLLVAVVAVVAVVTGRRDGGGPASPGE